MRQTATDSNMRNFLELLLNRAVKSLTRVDVIKLATSVGIAETNPAIRLTVEFLKTECSHVFIEGESGTWSLKSNHLLKVGNLMPRLKEFIRIKTNKQLPKGAVKIEEAPSVLDLGSTVIVINDNIPTIGKVIGINRRLSNTGIELDSEITIKLKDSKSDPIQRSSSEVFLSKKDFINVILNTLNGVCE